MQTNTTQLCLNDNSEIDDILVVRIPSGVLLFLLTLIISVNSTGDVADKNFNIKIHLCTPHKGEK